MEAIVVTQKSCIIRIPAEDQAHAQLVKTLLHAVLIRLLMIESQKLVIEFGHQRSSFDGKLKLEGILLITRRDRGGLYLPSFWHWQAHHKTSLLRLVLGGHNAPDAKDVRECKTNEPQYNLSSICLVGHILYAYAHA